MSAPRVPICSGCLRPWTSPRYHTCDSCRSRQRRPSASTISHPLAPTPTLENSDLPSKRRRRQNNSSFENDPAPVAVRQAVHLLEDEFHRREAASHAFPPDISSSLIRESVSKFEDEMSAASKRTVCSSCGQFVLSTDVHRISDSNNSINCLRGCLDICGRHDDVWQFCSPCHSALRAGKIPKLSARNSINVTTCQHYPSVLEDLTVVEESLIAKCHPVGTILKLRPGGRSSPVAYNALRGHMIVIPQDPGPLLDILPSPDLKLNDIIKVVWLGKLAPAISDLKPFLQVRKEKVLSALQYLVQHNHLYHDLTINHNLINSWDSDFIPPDIEANIIHIKDPDHAEREGYTVSLQAGNHENDFQAAQDSAFQADDQEPLVTGSVYTDINGERQDPNVRMVDALLGAVAGRSGDMETPTDDGVHVRHSEQRNVPTISYAIRGQAALLNHWQDSHYFTAAFPTLFPCGTGGHRDERPLPVSLMAFAEWALKHHSRR